MLSLQDEFLHALHPTGEPAVVNDSIADRIRELLALVEPPRYERAYEIERLLVHIRSSSHLRIEVDRRVTEAQTNGLPRAAGYRSRLDQADADLAKAQAGVAAAETALVTPPAGADAAQLQALAVQARAHRDAIALTTDTQRRAILTAVLDDLQWLYQKQHLIRRALIRSAASMACLGSWAVFMAGLPFFAFLYERQTNSTFFSHFVDKFPNYGLYTAISFGLVGAFFSRLISLNSNRVVSVEDAENLYGLRSLAIRGAVGMFGAMIIYFLLRTGILGSVAPDLEKLSYTTLPVKSMIGDGTVLLPSSNWCLLVVWSFLAGFSEKLVPDSLASAESQMSGKKT
jgi:hypothetical protein